MAEEDQIIELGDTFTFWSKQYGELKGQIYYRSEDLIRVLPDGVANRLYDFPLIDNDFDPEFEFGDPPYALNKKHILEGFVQQQDLQAGQFVETFTADGDRAGRYFIKSVDPEADTAIFVDETGADLPQIDFGYMGIPLDAPFAVLTASAEELPAPEQEVEVDALNAQAEAEAEEGIATPADAVAIPEMNGEGTESPLDEDGEIDLEFAGSILLPTKQQALVLPIEQRVYPDVVQKSDALQDFTTLLNVKEQQDVRELRRIRALTETLFALKQELVEYNEDGSFKAIRQTSIKTVGELVKQPACHLSRPVLDTTKKLYFLEASEDNDNSKQYLIVDTNSREINVAEANDGKRNLVETAYLQAREEGLSEEEIEEIVSQALERLEATEIEEDSIADPLTIINFRNELLQIKQFLSPIPSLGANSKIDSTLQFWIVIQAFIQRFNRPWTATENEGADESDEGIWIAQERDSEFFRAQIPQIERATVRGLVSGDGQAELLTLDRVNFSLNRALKKSMRLGKDNKRVELFSAEGAPVRAYLLFPFKYKASIGASRTGFLATDMANAENTNNYTMARILKNANGVSEEARSDSIIAIGPDGNTLGAINIAEYIRGLTLRGFGPADMTKELAHIGYNNIEWTIEMGEELARKVLSYINATKAYIEGLRKALEALKMDSAPISNLLFEKEEMAWLFDEAIPGEPLLAAAFAEFKNQSPRLSGSDYASLSHLIVKHVDYLLAAAGQNELQIARERLRTTRANFLTALRIAVKIRDAIRGKAPEPNTCEHVQRLRDIRRITDDSERMQQLVRFLLRYQGLRENNYVQCSVCKRDLICSHEIIELKQFVNPREREALRKELLLNFCGPVMGTTYQCRNCGQGMGEIEYDDNMQFDDNGRPMTGYAVLEDKEALQMTEIDRALGFKAAEVPTEVDFGNDARNLIYRTIREIADRVGVYPNKTDYERMIGQVQALVADLGDRETFVAQQQAMAAQMGRKVKLPDYDMVQNRTMVAATAAYLLINIQTKIPDYMPSMVIGGCKNPGFRGYPMDEEENTQGQEYLACAVSTIMRNAAPWNMTGFQREQVDVKRQKLVFKVINTIIRDAMDKPDVQQLLATKRKYRQEVFGTGGSLGDQVSPFFLPLQRVSVNSETIVIPEVETAMTVGARSDIWIQTGNKIAAKVANERGELIIGSPFSEATCCYDQISTPQSFWLQAKLPQLPLRTLQPGALVSRLLVRFQPRPLAELLVDAPENLYFILFLKVCATGTREGLPHEPGLNHMCPHCQFQFPASRLLMDIEEGKAALEAQNVEITKQTFTTLLDKVHERYSVPRLIKEPLQGALENMQFIGTMNPAPVMGWPGIIEQTIQKFMSMPPDANALNIQETLSELSEVGAESIASLEGRLRKDMVEILNQMIAMPASQLAQICLSYFIIPFSRLVNQLDADVLIRLNPSLMEELSGIHISDIKTEVLLPNILVQSRMRGLVGKAAFARAKLNYCVQQLSQVPSILEKITATNIPGGERTLRYLVRALIFAPLASLVNPNEIPFGAELQEKLILDSSVQIIYDVLRLTFNKYRDEWKSYSNDHIREVLQIRAEKEKSDVIKKLDDLSEDMRRVELLKKQLRMGDWAVGGSKKITQYDKDQYEVEREARARAGISDFISGGFGPEGPHEINRPLGDDNGIYNFGGNDEGTGRLDSDMMRTQEDDY